MKGEAVLSATRSHEICAGHRVVGHEGKCQRMHGHGYVFTFELEADVLDDVGRVLDFGVMKATLCAWLESEWDHKFLMWEHDPLLPAFQTVDPKSLCVVPFNPTAELMADHLLREVGPKLLEPHPEVRLVSVRVQETGKCAAVATLI